MSLIGIYDADMNVYTHTPFNIDAMKIAAYEKKQKNIVNLTQTTDTDKYTKLIYRKDYYDGNFDSNLLMKNNVEYGGRAFDHGIYQPLPLEIESCIPDRYLYASMEKRFGTNKVNREIFKQMSRAQHIRISLDGKTIWKDWRKQLDPNGSIRTCIIHDYDILQINGAINVIKEILNSMPGTQTKYLGLKFPLHIYDAATLMEWAQFTPMNKFYTIYYHGLLTDQELVDFYQLQKGTSICTQMIYDITYGCTEESFIKNRIEKIYYQLVFLRSNCQQISLKYDDTIFSDKRWVRILNLYEHFLKQLTKMSKKSILEILPTDSLFHFVSHFRDNEDYKFWFNTINNPLMLKDEARELFRFIQQENYNLFKAFYECHTVYLDKGEFKYD